MKTPFLFLLAVVLLGSALYLRGQAHAQSVTQAKAIVAADLKAQLVAADIAKLKAFVQTHAGGGVTFSLIGSYNRAKAAAEEAARQSNGTGTIYSQAQSACAGRADSIRQAQCVQSYLGSHLTNQPTAAPIAPPEPKNYIYILKSPALAWDLATFLLAASLALSIFGFSRLSMKRRA